MGSHLSADVGAIIVALFGFVPFLLLLVKIEDWKDRRENEKKWAMIVMKTALRKYKA